MRQDSLYAFITAARCRSFSEAAREMQTTQSNISRHIGLLEKELGFSLFNRARRPLELTRAGEYYLSAVSGIPSQMQKAREAALRLDKQENSQVTIGVLGGLSITKLLPHVISELTRKEGNIDVTIETAGMSGLRKGIENSQFDIIFTISYELPDILAAGQKKYCEIMPIVTAIAVNTGNPLSGYKELMFNDIKNEQFITISPKESRASYEDFKSIFSAFGVKPKIARLVSNFESLMLSVEMNQGIALVDIDNMLKNNGGIRFIPYVEDPPDAFCVVVAVWKQNAKTAVHRLAGFCAENIEYFRKLFT